MNPDLDEVVKEFTSTLDEVDVLILTAEENIADNLRYSTFIKSAILLLSGKFENFIELISETYVYELNKLNMQPKKIPDSIKYSHSTKIIDKINNKRNNGVDQITKQLLNELGTIWVLDEQPFNKFQIDCKFSYGKHGETELQKLFSNIGINNILDQIKIELIDEVDPSIVNQIDFKGTFNSITGLRNNILHQDASPNLTHIDVSTNLAIIKAFSTKLLTYLDDSLTTIINS